jgi:hypothetical protein
MAGIKIRDMGFPASARTPHDDKSILRDVRAGLRPVWLAAAKLGWTVDDVRMAIWGRVAV